jgi:hypothetical protein
MKGQRMAAQQGQPQWWRRGRSAAQARLRDISAQAAATFVELDALQRRVELRSTLHTGRRADDLAVSWQSTCQEVDAAIQGYLRAVERHDIEADLDEDDAFLAGEVFAGCHHMLRRAIGALSRFDV